MTARSPFALIAFALILARTAARLWLSRLNRRHVQAHAQEVPPAFRGFIDKATYRRSTDYTLAKGRFENVADLFDAVLLIAVLFSGLLPWDGLCVGCGRQTDFLARRREARVGVTRTARASHSQMGTRSLVAHSGSHTRARSPRKHPSCALSRWSSFALTVLLMLDKGS